MHILKHEQQNLTKTIASYQSKMMMLVMSCLIIMTCLIFVSHHVFAQKDYRSLILSDNNNEHYLSPYLTRYIETDQISSVKDIISKPFLQSEVLSSPSSLILLDTENETNWLSFHLNNQSNTQQWKFDFGKGIDGRFGFIQNISAFVYTPAEKKLYQYDIEDIQSPILDIAQNQKIQITLKIQNSKGLPFTAPIKLIKADMIIEKTSFLFNILNIFLIGMIFFFIAVFVLKLNFRFLLFSFYYAVLLGLLNIQDNSLIYNLIPTGFDVHIYIIFMISIIALAIGHTQWESEGRPIYTRLSFIIPTLISIISIVTGHFINQESGFLVFFLTFVPSIFVLIFITLYSLMDDQSKDTNSTAFILGWLIFLFGICISILSLSGIIQPTSMAINAYWFTLMPQAFFFAIYARQSHQSGDQNVVFSRTLEINENENVSRLKQSKENAEHERLLKVIEQERRTLSELRKSEARQTEKMREAKERADAANKGKSDFLAVVSHEIRTPMTGIMGMIRMLLNSNLTKEQTEHAQTIQDSSDAMLALLNDILDYEKIEQGKMTFEEINFDLHRLLKGVATLMQGHATQKNITLETIIGDDLPQFVMADPTRLRQVLLNLTGNAIKFTEKGCVKITAQAIAKSDSNKSHEIYFSVSDQGIGISEEAQKNLFTPFSQADKSISRKFGGTGLGLAISNGLINAMGSEININSKEGEGSVFFYTINMKSGDVENTPAAKETRKLTPLSIQKILIVDDNHINQKVVGNFLSDLPYTLDFADNAETAIEKIKSDRPNFIFMDIELPGMNGDEAAKIIRNQTDEVIRNTPIVALTGNIGNEYVSKYLEAGINAFVAKPIDPDKLVQSIKDAEKGLYSQTSATPIVAPKITQKEDKPQKPEEEKPTPSTAKEIKKSAPPPPLAAPIISPPLTSKTEQKQKKNKSNNSILDVEMLDNLKKHLNAESMNEMLDDVFEKSDEIINHINKSLGQGNMKAIVAQCHDLKGMTGNFGLKELSEFTQNLEEKAKSQPPIVVSGVVSKLPDKKKRAQEALQEWLKKDS